MGDLDINSLSEVNGDFYVDNDIPGTTKRPKSLYEGSGRVLVNNQPQVYNYGIVLVSYGFGKGFYFSFHFNSVFLN